MYKTLICGYEEPIIFQKAYPWLLFLRVSDEFPYEPRAALISGMGLHAIKAGCKDCEHGWQMRPSERALNRYALTYLNHSAGIPAIRLRRIF